MAYPKILNTAILPRPVTVGPCSPVLCVIVFLCQSHTPGPSIPRLCLFSSKEYSTVCMHQFLSIHLQKSTSVASKC